MFDRRRGALATAAIAIAALAAGCSQEGRLIDTPLEVRAVAYDQVSVIDTSATSISFNTRFKILVHAASPCEAGHILLEVSRTGTTDNPLFVIRPIARYNADDPCTNQPVVASDTTMTLVVNAFTVANAAVTPFTIKNGAGPDFTVSADSAMHPATPATIRFQIKVEDKATALAIAGATVQLDSLTTTGGGVLPIANGVTDVNGVYAYDVSSNAAIGVDAIRYRVTVTNGSDVVVMNVRAAPARGQSRERVTVRI